MKVKMRNYGTFRSPWSSRWRGDIEQKYRFHEYKSVGQGCQRGKGRKSLTYSILILFGCVAIGPRWTYWVFPRFSPPWFFVTADGEIQRWEDSVGSAIRGTYSVSWDRGQSSSSPDMRRWTFRLVEGWPILLEARVRIIWLRDTRPTLTECCHCLPYKDEGIGIAELQNLHELEQ